MNLSVFMGDFCFLIQCTKLESLIFFCSVSVTGKENQALNGYLEFERTTNSNKFLPKFTDGKTQALCFNTINSTACCDGEMGRNDIVIVFVCIVTKI